MAEVISTQYTVREMLEAIRQRTPRPTFLMDTLVKGTKTHASKIIEIDTIVGSNTVAKYVSRTANAEPVDKLGYSSAIHVIPYTYQEKTLTPEDLEIRMPGETVYGSGSPSQRRDELMGEWLAELEDRVIRREELQLAGALREGTVTVDGDGVSYTVDYGRNASNTATLTGTSRWGESAENKVTDVRNAFAQMKTPGVDGGLITTAIMGVTAAQKWIDDDDIMAIMDNRRVERGEISPTTLAEQSASYIGNYKDAGVNMDIYSYFGQYVDSSGTAQYYLPANEVLFVNSTMRVQKHYGMIYNLHAGNFVVERFPYMDVASNGKSASLTLESAPLIATHEPNKCYRLKTYG